MKKIGNRAIALALLGLLSTGLYTSVEATNDSENVASTISNSTQTLGTKKVFDFDETTNPVLKIGFLYGSNAVASTNLDNYTGSGHSFGYFDSDFNFTSVFQTENETISVLKNDTIYLGTDNLYYDTKLSNSQGIIGGYSIELSQTFSTAQEAQAVASNFIDAFVVYIDGVYKVRVDTFSTQTYANEALEDTKIKTGDEGAYVVYPRDDLYTVTSTKTTKVLFQFADNGKNFGILPNGDITWTKGYRYYGGFEYSRLDGDDITVVNVVAMQDYIKGVLPYEMSASWNVEALKAQALCARSYAYNCINKHSRYGFDLCNTTDCQVYNGTSASSSNSDSAVEQTYGEYIDYKGTVATGFFYSSNGGATENSENVWVEAIPYLRAKIDPYERSEEVGNGVWEVSITNSQIASILQAKGYSQITGVKDMYIKEYTDVGNVYTLTVVASNGTEYDFTKERARTILSSTTYGISLNSIRYRINEVMPSVTQKTETDVYINGEKSSSDEQYYIIGSNGVSSVENINGMTIITADGTNEIIADTTTTQNQSTPIAHASGEYVISGRGWGHNVGMSQFGAKHMAEAGYTYEDIIEFYFDGTTVKKYS